MKYLLPCKCGESVEVEPGQAGQTVVCGCGESLLVPSMLQVKALPKADEKPVLSHKKHHIPYRAALIFFVLGIVCLTSWGLLELLKWRTQEFFAFALLGLASLLYVSSRGLAFAFLLAALALAIRDWAKSPLAEDTTLRRTFFVLGIALLFPACFFTSYWHEWKPHPRHATLKRIFFSYGTYQRPLHQDSTPIPRAETRILWMTDEEIDHLMPMDLHLYFQTLKEPMFSHNFRENYEAVWATYRIWITVNVILFILAFSSIIVSFFMPKQTVEVTGWSGSEW